MMTKMMRIGDGDRGDKYRDLLSKLNQDSFSHYSESVSSLNPRDTHVFVTFEDTVLAYI